MARLSSQRALLSSLQTFGLALSRQAIALAARALRQGRRLQPKTLRPRLLDLFQRRRKLLTHLAGLMALGGLVMWNWKLILALGVGVGAMVLVYALQRLDWRQWLNRLRPWFAGPQKILLLSVGTGSFAMLGTYMAASVWETEHSPWLASSLLLQGLGMMVVLVFLTLQVMGREGDRLELNSDPTLFDPTLFDQTLDNLAHPEPLKRLLAIRQLQRLRTAGQLTSDQERVADQVLQLLLHQESEAAVREALLRSLPLKPLNLQPLKPKARPSQV